MSLTGRLQLTDSAAQLREDERWAKEYRVWGANQQLLRDLEANAEEWTPDVEGSNPRREEAAYRVYGPDASERRDEGRGWYG